MSRQLENGVYSIGGRDKEVGSSNYGLQSGSKPANDDTYEATMGEGPIPGKESGNPSHGISHLFSVYSDKSSISGMPFIKNTKYTSVRIVWSILLFLAVVTMGLHLYKLCEEYFEYETYTKVDMAFSSLHFPAVTFCNVNPVRVSKIRLASDDLRYLVGEVKPEVLDELYDEWSTLGFSKKRRRKRSTNSSDESLNNTSTSKDLGSNSSSVNQDPDAKSTDLPTEEDINSGVVELPPTSAASLRHEFYHYLNLEDGLTRQLMGHEVGDMLLSCYYGDRQCFSRNFNTTSSSQYGNCFTLDSETFIARQSGPRQGLELMVHLQIEEYIPTISSDKGIQVVIHDHKSMPFPDEEGFSVAAHTSTFVGLRKLEISRKGSPYGDCTSTDGFFKRYKILYTRQTCQKLCLQRYVWSDCKCFDGRHLTLNNILTIPENLTACQTSDELLCVHLTAYEFEEKYHSRCGCDNPCKESKYKKSISFREWPSPSMARSLVEEVCRKDPNACPALRNKTDTELLNEFLKLTIYFEDLNHEIMEETPDYELFQFVSDIGGTVGLWIGLSVLSVFEIFHLCIAIFRYVFCGNWRKKRKASFRGTYASTREAPSGLEYSQKL